MRVAPAGYLNLGLRAHELLRGVPLYDVSEVDLPGGGAGRNLADIRALRSAIDSSLIAKALFGTRYFLGRVFGWDRVTMRPDESLLSRLTDRDRMESQVAPGTAEGPFRLLYQFPGEALAEIRNATVHGYVCVALIPTTDGYRLYGAVYVRAVSWLTRPYLALIEPFRRLLYPVVLRRLRHAWIAAYGSVRRVPT